MVLESVNVIDLCEQLKTIKHDIFYLAVILNRFNEIDLSFQEFIRLINYKNVIYILENLFFYVIIF